jgi:transcriptional antiterminator RfaH
MRHLRSQGHLKVAGSEGEQEATDLMGARWYAVYTKPRCEQKAAEGLTRRSLETFLPKIEVLRKRQSRSVRQAEPLFPCYVFARIETNSEHYLAARWTPGVRKILGAGDPLSSVPDSVISYIREQMGASGAIRPRQDFKAGDAVRIRKGPLRDLVGIFKGEVSPTGRVKVLMNILQNSSGVEVHLSEIEKEYSSN